MDYDYVSDNPQDDDEVAYIDYTQISEDLLTLVRKTYLLYVANQTMALSSRIRKKHRLLKADSQNDCDSDIETYAKRLKKLCNNIGTRYKEKHCELRQIAIQDENLPITDHNPKRPSRLKPSLKELPETAEPQQRFFPHGVSFRESYVNLKPIQQIVEVSAPSIPEIAPSKKPEPIHHEIMETVQRILSLVVGSFQEKEPVKVREEPVQLPEEPIRFEDLFGARKRTVSRTVSDDDERTRIFWEERRRTWETSYREDVKELLGFDPPSDTSMSAEEDEKSVVESPCVVQRRSRKSSASSAPKTPKWQRQTPKKISFSRRSGRAVKPPELVDL